MSGLFNSLSTARRAIWASRTGIDVASHNIANVNTPGFSRQRVALSTVQPLNATFGQIGLGVEVAGINRVRNQLLDLQFRQANQDFSSHDIRANIFTQVETIILEPSDSGIGGLMTDFFNEFSTLGSEPDNTAHRNTVIQKAADLASAFRTKSQSLTQIRSSLESDIESTVAQINQATAEIAELNRQISVMESTGSAANDMRDRRDLLLDQLSENANITYTESHDGTVAVSISGQLVVGGTVNRELTIASDTEQGKLMLRIVGSAERDLSITGGKLSGMLDMHNSQINTVLDNLNALASTFIEEVNHLHNYGFGLPTGTPPVSNTGLDLFDGTNAATIQVSSEVENNSSNLAASLDGSEGNGDVAFAISNLREQGNFDGGTQTFNDFYGNIVADLGTEIQLAVTSRDNQDLLKLQIDNQRAAESAVSLDEEMTELIKYQRSLEAASRVIHVVDEALGTLINMV